jgi:hypothetical protein
MLKTTNYNLDKPELSDLALITKLSDNMDIIDAELFKQASEAKSYTTLKSSKDANFIYTTYERKRYNGTLLMRSVLSGGTSPLYTTRVETWYALNGITVLSTKTYTITYDSDGIVVSEV